MRILIFLLLIFFFIVLNADRIRSDTEENLDRVHRELIEAGYRLTNKKYIYSDLLQTHVIEFDNLLKCSNINDTCIVQTLERTPLNQLFTSRATIGDLQLLNRLKCNQIEATCFNSTRVNNITFPLQCDQVNSSCFPTPYVQPNSTSFNQLNVTDLKVQSISLTNPLQCLQINSSCFPTPYVQPNSTSFVQLNVTNLNVIGDLNFVTPLQCSKIDPSCIPPPYTLPSIITTTQVNTSILIAQTVQFGNPLQCLQINSSCFPPSYVQPNSTSFNQLNVTDLKVQSITLTTPLQCTQINSTCFNLPSNATFNTLTTQRIANSVKITTNQLQSTSTTTTTLTSNTATIGSLSLTTPLSCSMLDISCVPQYTLPPDIYVNSVNSLGENLFIQAQLDLYLNGVNSKQLLKTIEPRNYKTMSAMFQGPDPTLLYQLVGILELKD
jgi:hypothetical protein